MKQKKDTVSILISTYNAQDFIIPTINSCLNQTYSKTETLILDDASTDNTVESIKKLNHPQIKLFEGNKNGGPYNGLNFLIDKAKGEYIAIQDHDDVWLPQKLTKQIKYLKDHPNKIACGSRAYVFYESKNVLILDKPKPDSNYVSHTSLVFRNQGYRYQPHRYLADEYFEKITLEGNTKKIHCLKDALSIHRIRGDRHNLSRIRFKFNNTNLAEYISVNGFSPTTLINLIGIFVSKYFPPSLEWFIITKIVKRSSQQIPLTDFQKHYPDLI